MQTKIAEKTTDTQTENGFEINEEVRKVLNWFNFDEIPPPLFLAGKAGTGKSTLIRYLMGLCKERGLNCVVVTPTGVAAHNIGKGAKTIHSFFGLPLLDDFKKMPFNLLQLLAWRLRDFEYIDLLIIDEISMVKADVLDVIDQMLRIAYRDEKNAFGGTKVLLCGDLYQLPPVFDRKKNPDYLKNYASEYFFHAQCCQDEVDTAGMFNHIELEQIYRQKDGEFIDILNCIRNGTLSDRALQKLNKQVGSITTPDSSGGTFSLHLCTKNVSADEYNQKVLGELPGELVTSKAVIESYGTTFPKSMYPTDEVLYFKEGAQVMFINNSQDQQWVNGTLGRIVKIKENGLLEILTDRGTKVYTNGYSFTHEDHKGSAVFRQYPFRLAWAVTIHKSQGLTFDHLSVDFGDNVFAPAMVYVALSRCRSLEGLTLKRAVKHSDIKTSKILKNHKKYFTELPDFGN